MALEVGRLARHGKPTCSECTTLLQQKRGCRRPGFDYPRKERPVQLTSPLFVHDPPLKECPVGYLLREAPHTFDTLDAVSLVGNASPIEFAAMTPYAQRAARLYNAEVARLLELELATRRTNSDLEHGRRVLTERGG